MLSASNPPDTELVARSLAGERDAFGALVTRHQAAACGVAYAVNGDFPASEDVAQEAFVSAWKQLRALRETGRFRAWVCGIARQIALSQVRKRDRRGDRTPEELSTEPIAETDSPRDDAMFAEESALLWQTLDQLDENYREPLVLFYREQQSIAAVATALDLSEDAVKQRLSRGRALLRDELAKRIEGLLGRTRPGAGFTAAVLSALPPVVAGVGLATAAGTAKAATTGGAGTSSATVGGAAGTTIAASVASGAVGLLSLYVFYRFVRAPEIPREVRRVVARTAAASLGVAIVFATFVLWIALTRGAVLASHGIAPAAALVSAIIAFIAANMALSLRASRLLAGLPLWKTAVLSPAQRYVSPWRFAGLPLVHIAFGADPARGERRGTARGWIAVGDIAFGGVALGGLAVGPIAVGGVSLGLLSLGGAAAGALVFGGVALGWVCFGGAALAWHIAVGGLAIAHNFADGGLAVSAFRAVGGVALAPIANAPGPDGNLALPSSYRWVTDLLPHAGWLTLLGLPGLLVALRHLRRSRR